jgi:hypothetical protein
MNEQTWRDGFLAGCICGYFGAVVLYRAWQHYHYWRAKQRAAAYHRAYRERTERAHTTIPTIERKHP